MINTLDSAAMNYFHDVYLGFLAEQIARQCEQMSALKCSACESKIKSPLLHICHQRGLLEKLQIHFEEVRGPMLRGQGGVFMEIFSKSTF